MLKTFEAIIDQNGNVSLLEKFQSDKVQRALVTIIEQDSPDESTLLSEAALEDWNKPGEDEVWAHLQ